MELLTPKEVAEILRVSKTTVWKITKDGKLPCLRIGRSVRYRKEDVENFIMS